MRLNFAQNLRTN